jgi:ABC-type antimicrobial peptide transport system permease subunit
MISPTTIASRTAKPREDYDPEAIPRVSALFDAIHRSETLARRVLSLSTEERPLLIMIYKQCRRELGRVALTVLAIGAIIAEMFILEGFLAGMYVQLRSAVLNRGGDVIVTQSGISNFIAARSILPQLTRLKVEEIEGVREAHPLTALSVIYDRDGRKTPIIILVYDTAGGPQEIISGTPIGGEREIVIDQALAKRYGFSPGDRITISDFDFKISGISENSAAFFTPFAFITYDGLIDFYFESDIAADIATFPLLSFLLVDTEPGADPKTVIERIRRYVTVADAFLPGELAQRDENLGRELMGPILGLLLVVSYGIGALIIGMFMFAAVRSRLRSLGVMRALGFTPVMLGTAVVIEAGVLTLLAIPLGIALSHVLAVVIHALAPVYLILPMEPAALARTAVVCLALAGLGALAPVRLIAGMDPAVVFRS